MSRTVTILCAAALAVSLPAPAITQAGIPDGFVPTATQEQVETFHQAKTLVACSPSELPQPASAATAPRAQLTKGTSAKSVTAVADLEGQAVMSFEISAASSTSTGIGVTIAAIEGTDSISITNFWEADAVVKAKVDISTMTISIPNQVIGYSSTYGNYDIAYYSTSGINRSTDIPGIISADGTITFSSYWGVFITSGTYANYYYGIYYNTLVEPTNCTMTYNIYKSGSFDVSSFPVTVSQSADTLYVKNFYNNGSNVYIKLRADSTAKIDNQYLYTAANGYALYTYGVTYTAKYYVSTLEPCIACDTAANARTVSWGAWIPYYFSISTGSTSGYYPTARTLDGTIEVDFDITYPTATLGLEGEGSADSPFLVASAADWESLAKYIDDSGDNFTGKYVKIAADIDFDGSAMTPLCYDRTIDFNGDLDGGGKTISGYVNIADFNYYGAVAPSTGYDAIIHDLTLGGKISTGYYNTGGFVGIIYGKLSNLTHAGAITSTNYYTGGVTGCTTEGSTVSGCLNTGTLSTSGGYGCGIVGECESGSYLEYCGNTGTVTYTGSTSFCCSSGVAGYCRPGTFIGCYNEGKVQTSSSKITHVFGVISYTLRNSLTIPFIIKDCYNTADLTAYSYASGVVGTGNGLTAVNIEGCYNTGNITSATSYAAGIVLYSSVADTVNNCFNTGDITATTSYAGGMSDYSGGIYTNCYNAGTVTSADYAGGLVGCPVLGTTAVATGYSSGTVVSSGTCGNIIGADISSSTYWGDGNSLSGTYYLTASAVEDNDTVSAGLTRAELAALELDGWINGDSYTYPILADNDWAKAYAAAVIVADGDSYSSVTTGFNVGTPDGVTWSASPAVVDFSGNTATFTETYAGTLALTATCGEASVTTSLTCNVEVDGVSPTCGDCGAVVSREFYTPSGLLVDEPADGKHAIYIVVTTRADGSTTTAKEVR